MYLLDTNVVSEFRRNKPHGAVLAWAAQVAAEALFIPAIVFDELQSGVELTRRRDAMKAAEIEGWINQLAATANVIKIDAEIARETARLMQKVSGDYYEDAMIAACAKVTGMIVVSRNVRDFARFSVKIFDPFQFAGEPRE